MTHNILVLEDNEIQRQHLKKIINAYDLNYRAYICKNISEALEVYSKKSISLYILDVHLGNENGIEFAKYVIKQNKNNPVKLIFVSAHRQYALKAINETHCFDYLLKPYSKFDLYKVMAEIMDLQVKKNTVHQFIHFYINKYKISLNIYDIVYIEYIDRKLNVVTTDKKYLCSRKSLSTITQELEDNSIYDLVRCHKSYMVNKKHITKINMNSRNSHINTIRGSIPSSKVYLDNIKNLI